MIVMKKQLFREDLLQWIWKNLEFDLSGFTTLCGRRVDIIEPGSQNPGEGADFSAACIRMDGMEFHGDVEIHYRSSEWIRHGHHKQEEYNRVVLHVVYEHESSQPLLRKDGTELITAELKPQLHTTLASLLKKRNGSSLPCAGAVSMIHQQAFILQVKKAEREYFEYKCNELLSGYDPDLPLEKAWKKAFVLQIYALLGIPGNRNEMKELAERVHNSVSLQKADNFIDQVLQAAFLEKEPERMLIWKQYGMRPSSRPQKRVRQAASLHHAICSHSLKSYMSNPESTWQGICSQSSFLPGNERLQMVHTLAYLPALYLLGKLLHSNDLMSWAAAEWQREPFHLPGEITSPFREAGFLLDRQTETAGLAHQLKRYCHEKRCTSCKVFKSAIRS